MAQRVPGSGHAILGEGPLWSDRQNALFWVDIIGKRLHRLSLGDGAVDSWDMPECIGWVIERQNLPGFIAGMAGGFAELTLDPLSIRPIIDPEVDKPGNRMNDAKADGQGRIWAGTMPVSCMGASGAFYRLDVDLSCTRVDQPYTIPNGPALTADGSFLFHTDSALRTVFQFKVNDDGSLGPRTPHIIFQDDWGTPDGMTFDADGFLWVAHWGTGQVSRFDPDGTRERSIPIPASQVTSMAFAGDHLDRMFVTTAANGVDEPLAGALFEIEPGCRGQLTQRFGG